MAIQAPHTVIRNCFFRLFGQHLSWMLPRLFAWRFLANDQKPYQGASFCCVGLWAALRKNRLTDGSGADSCLLYVTVSTICLVRDSISLSKRYRCRSIQPRVVRDLASARSGASFIPMAPHPHLAEVDRFGQDFPVASMTVPHAKGSLLALYSGPNSALQSFFRRQTKAGERDS